MPVIPGYVAQRRLDPGGTPDVTPQDLGAPGRAMLARSVEGFGNAVQTAAVTGMAVQRREDQFRETVRYQRLGLELDRDLDESEMPEGGSGFVDAKLKQYDERFESFLKETPDHLKDEMRLKGQLLRESYTSKASRRARAESERFQIDSFNSTSSRLASAVEADPDSFDGAGEAARSMLEQSTLDPDKRRELERLDGLRRRQAAIRGHVIRGDADAARAIAAAPELEASAVATYQKLGWSPVAAGGIAGGLVTESGLRTGATNKGDGRDGSDSIGIAQWNGPRAKALKAFAEGRGKNWTDLETQLLFVDHELRTSKDPNTRRAAELLKAAKTPEEAALAFTFFERPKGWSPQNPAGAMHFNRRLAHAQRLAGGAGDLTFEERSALSDQAERLIKQREAEVSAANLKAYKVQENELQVGLQDGTFGLPDIDKARKDGWLTDADAIAKMTGIVERRDKEIADTTAFGQAAMTPGFKWNRFDPAHEKLVDAGFKALGGDLEALSAIVDQTGVVPKAAAQTLRAGLVSSNAAETQEKLTVAANLLRRDPMIFEGIDGAREIEAAARQFDYLVDKRGMTAAEAVSRIREQETPEYKARFKQVLGAIDPNKAVKDTLGESDLSEAFDEGAFVSEPELGDERNRREAFRQYETAFREALLERGDPELAKADAIAAIKKTWGVSRVSGAAVLVQYPPERAPAYAGIENVSDKIAEQALADLKGITKDIPARDKLILRPNADTARAFKAGEPPSYSIGWLDKNGVYQEVPGFYADPAKMKADQSAARQKEFAAEDAAMNAMLRGGGAMPENDNTARRIQAEQDRTRSDSSGRWTVPPRRSTPD